MIEDFIKDCRCLENEVKFLRNVQNFFVITLDNVSITAPYILENKYWHKKKHLEMKLTQLCTK